MDDFVNLINLYWESGDTVRLSAEVLWRLNFIHPFINGNGRTARAACYFVLCVKCGWMSGVDSAGCWRDSGHARACDTR